MIDKPERPGILRANASFLLAGAGLVLLNVLSPYLVKLLEFMGVSMSGIELICALDALYYIPCVLLPVIIFGVKHGGAGLRLEPASISQTLLCLAAAYLCVMLANCLAAIWTLLLEAAGLTLYSAEIPMANTTELLLAVFAVAVLPGICEELLFRGVVLSAYEAGGTRRALMISTALFAVLHGSVQGLPVQLAIGLVLGLAVCFTGSLYTGMMIHTAYNAFILLINYVNRNVDVPQNISTYEHLGGIPGIFVVLFQGAIAAGLLALILLAFRKQGSRTGVCAVPRAGLSLDATSVIVLLSGFVTVAFMYGQDILMLTGYLG